MRSAWTLTLAPGSSLQMGGEGGFGEGGVLVVGGVSPAGAARLPNRLRGRSVVGGQRYCPGRSERPGWDGVRLSVLHRRLSDVIDPRFTLRRSGLLKPDEHLHSVLGTPEQFQFFHVSFFVKKNPKIKEQNQRLLK